MNDFWQHCSALLERELTPQQYVTWIKPLAPVAFDAAANTLSIAAPNRFKLDWVKSQFSGRISDMARDFWHAPVDVQFVLDPKAGMRAPAATSSPAPSRPSSAPGATGGSHSSGSNGGGAAVDAAVGAVQSAHAARANGANSAMATLNANARAAADHNANARAAADHNANARAAADDAADLDLPSLDANEAAAARRTWRPGQSASSNGNGENDSMYERSKLNPVLTFDNFVTGKANQLARAAAIQ
ncbi:DnaA N-terminal domain-containing protein, partial [Paraburkholderia sediminicola]|uniref:DnaA N-terminal domain-containing protein n=1 Tax=Paraburkholderia sediminicola TaxID=458836 RepID=UPI0038B8513B